MPHFNHLDADVFFWIYFKKLRHLQSTNTIIGACPHSQGYVIVWLKMGAMVFLSLPIIAFHWKKVVLKVCVKDIFYPSAYSKQKQTTYFWLTENSNKNTKFHLKTTKSSATYYISALEYYCNIYYYDSTYPYLKIQKSGYKNI